MEEQTNKIITGYFDRLPANLKKVIISNDLSGQLSSIFKKHNLRIDEAATLENEIAFVLLGMERPSDFPENLKEHTTITEGKLLMVVRDVNDKIFSPIRSSLLSRQHGEKTDRPIKETKTVSAPVHATESKKRQPELKGVERSMPRDVERAKHKQLDILDKQREAQREVRPEAVPAIEQNSAQNRPVAPTNKHQEKEAPKKDGVVGRPENSGREEPKIPKDQKEFFEKNDRRNNDPYREAIG